MVYTGNFTAKQEISIILSFIAFCKASVYKSCKDVATNASHAVSGAYELEDGRHFFRIGDVPHCGSGGWSLEFFENLELHIFLVATLLRNSS